MTMADLRITFFEFGLLVHRPVGVTMLLPAKAHALSLEINGVRRPIVRGASIMLVDHNRDPQPQEPTRVANRGEFVFNLPTVVGHPLRVPASTLNGDVDPAVLNARITLSGGHLTERECSHGASEWSFPNGQTRAVTDLADYQVTIPDGRRWHLRINRTLIPVVGGDHVVFRNEDVLGGETGPFVDLEEFEALCDLAKFVPSALPVQVRPAGKKRFEPIGPFLLVPDPKMLRGGEVVCTVADIDQNG
jgi:hypothetical protein